MLKSCIAMADIKHRAQLALAQDKAQEKEKAVQALEKSLAQGTSLSISR